MLIPKKNRKEVYKYLFQGACLLPLLPRPAAAATTIALLVSCSYDYFRLPRVVPAPTTQARATGH